ncbi:MAG: hypothetical protein KGS72_28315, partial [Cyanobacteria bacterium REEB67]|nr:hypothetical protein [Cyanobacteria bacterium REEB67]
AFLVGMAVGLCVLLDPLYVIFFLIFEASTVWGLYPFTGFALIKKRYFGPELQFALAIALLLGSVFALIPSACARHYILDVIPINLDGYIEVLNALCYAGNSSDLRPEIYLGGLCVMVAAPFLGGNLVARFFAVATLLSLALLIGQTGILHYQSYPMLAFGIMTIAALLSPAHLPAPLRRAAIFSWLSSRLSALLSRGIALTPVFSARPGLAPAAIVTVCAGLTYFGERASIGANDLYQLNRLGYYGVADKRDIGVLGDVVEMYSKPREAVAILGLGLRPGFPVLTQLRRKPGLALTWGFPLDILHIMEAPVYDKQMFAVKDFSDAIYKDMSRRLSLKEGAPVLVLVDEGEVRTLLDEHSVSAALEANYVSCGGASLLDESSTAGHPSMEYVGYKSGFGIYRHK